VDMTKEEDQERAKVEPAARSLRRELFSDELIDELMSRVDSDGLALTGEGGFLPELVKAVLERGMDAELTGYLGYERGDPAGRGAGTRGTGPPRRPLGPRSATSTWTSHATATARSRRGWSTRVPGEQAGWRRRSSACTRAG